MTPSPTTVLRAYKYRLYPRNSQIPFLSQHFGATRFVYNYFLDLRKTSCNHGTRLSGFDCKKMLPSLKSTYPWLRDVNAQSLQESVLNLEKAYQRFFKDLGDYPKHKKKRGRQSFTVPQHFIVKGSYLYIPKLKTGLRVNFHRPLQGEIKSSTISREPSGKFFVSFSIEELIYTPESKAQSREETGFLAQSIDLGVKDLCTFFDGSKVEVPRYLRQALKKLARLQRQFSRKQKGGKNRNKARIRIARLHEHVKNQRSNFLHQLSREVVNENQVIYLEDLNVRGMARFGHLGLSVADAGTGEFVRQVEYKARWSGKQVVRIGRFYPSSKMCSECRYVNEGLVLEDREWTCPECGTRHDRDHNAAKNIMNVRRDTPEVTPVEKRTSVLSMKDMAVKRRARREDKSFSEKQETKASERTGARAL